MRIASASSVKGIADSTGQQTINALLIKHAREGYVVVRLKGGDPSVFGRLEEELEALAQAGIACEVRNDRLGGIAGEIPFVECWPELWVRHAGDALRARGLLDEALRPAQAAESWTCPACGELIEPQFAQCWHCATDRER